MTGLMSWSRKHGGEHGGKSLREDTCGLIRCAFHLLVRKILKVARCRRKVHKIADYALWDEDCWPLESWSSEKLRGVARMRTKGEEEVI